MSSRQPLQVFPSVAELARAAADRVVAAAQAAQQARGTFSIALSGGSTPRTLYGLLSQDSRVDWTKIEIWFGDERAVGPDHPDSNYRMAREALLSPAHVADAQVHRILGEATDLSVEARRYANELTSGIGVEGGWPVFDLMLQGIGTDGHTASLFPGTHAVSIRDQVAIPVTPLPYVRPAVPRVSLTAPVIQAAREILILVAGADKAPVLPEVLDGPIDLEKRPSQLIRQAHGQVLWMADAAAASGVQNA